MFLQLSRVFLLFPISDSSASYFRFCTKKNGNAIDQEIRADGKGKRNNIVTFSTRDSMEKAITGVDETNKYIAKRYAHEANSEAFLTQKINHDI